MAKKTYAEWTNIFPRSTHRPIDYAMYEIEDMLNTLYENIEKKLDYEDFIFVSKKVQELIEYNESNNFTESMVNLSNKIDALSEAVIALSAKLDADDGVTDTDYEDEVNNYII